MSFDATSPFHYARVVIDLDQAMEELGNGLELTWHSVQERVMHIRYRGEVVRAELRFTYSVEGEPQLELLQGSAGSIWGPEFAGMHHLGVWTDDFLNDVARLERSGMPVEVTLASRSTEGPSGFTYHNGRHGLRYELVPIEMKSAFDNWFSGGEFA